MLYSNYIHILNVLEQTTDHGVQTVIRLGGAFTKHLNEGTEIVLNILIYI